MFRFLRIIVIVFFVTNAYSQTNYYDSAKVYCQKNIGKAMLFADSALSIATSDLDIAKANYMLGYLYRGSKKYLLSIGHYKKSMELYKEIDPQQYMYLQLNQGINHELISSFELAIFYYNKFIALASGVNDESALAKVYRQKARLYRKMNRLDSAVILNLTAIKYYDKVEDHKNRSAILNVLGLVYFDLNKPQTAMDYFYASEREVDLESHNSLRSARTNFNVAKCLVMLGDTSNAIALGNKASALFLQSKPDEDYVALHHLLASITSTPKIHFELAINYAEQHNFTRTYSYRKALLVMGYDGDIKKLTQYELTVESIILEKDAALAMHQEVLGKELDERLTTEVALAKTTEQFALWQLLMFTLLGLISLALLYFAYRKTMRVKVGRKLAAQMAEMKL